MRTVDHAYVALCCDLQLSPNAVGVGRGRKRTVRSGKKRRKSYSERQAARWTVAELTKDVKVHIHVEQIAVFILRGGTMITFSQDSGEMVAGRSQFASFRCYG